MRFRRPIIAVMNNKSPEIVINIDERTEVLQPEHRFEAYCSDCKLMVEMATPKMASIQCGLSERQIFRSIEDRTAHFIETDRVLVCLNSVRKHKANSNTAGPEGA